MTMFLGILAVGATKADATSITLNFNIDHFGQAGPSPYGTITLNDFNSSGDVLVTIALNNGLQFINAGFDGTFAWNLKNNVDPVSVTGLPSGWTLTSASAGDLKMDGFGDFEYSINSPGTGGSTPSGSSISFHVLQTGLIVNSFAEVSTGGTNAYFAADVISGAGTQGAKTGAIGVTIVGTPTLFCTLPNECEPLDQTPEPGTLVLLGSGLLFAAMRLRRKSA